MIQIREVGIESEILDSDFISINDMQETAEKTLSGLLLICAWCKKVRDDDGYWQQVDHYFRTHSRIRFSHGMCSDCAEDFRKESAQL